MPTMYHVDVDAAFTFQTMQHSLIFNRMYGVTNTIEFDCVASQIVIVWVKSLRDYFCHTARTRICVFFWIEAWGMALFGRHHVSCIALFRTKQYAIIVLCVALPPCASHPQIQLIHKSRRIKEYLFKSALFIYLTSTYLKTLRFLFSVIVGSATRSFTIWVKTSINII